MTTFLHLSAATKRSHFRLKLKRKVWKFSPVTDKLAQKTLLRFSRTKKNLVTLSQNKTKSLPISLTRKMTIVVTVKKLFWSPTSFRVTAGNEKQRDTRAVQLYRKKRLISTNSYATTKTATPKSKIWNTLLRTSKTNVSANANFNPNETDWPLSWAETDKS